MDTSLTHGGACDGSTGWLAEGAYAFILWTVLAGALAWICHRLFMQKRVVRKLRNERKYIPSSAPPVFPNGWVPLLLSTDLRVNQVKPVTAVGKDLVAFRTEDGVAHVMDAYCPHLGAHLGVMGRVVGDCIECPFHGWRFQADTGACAHVPYVSTIPAFTKVKTWTCRETYGLIFVWFHADGEQPEWVLEDIAELSSGSFRQMSSFETTSYGHVQDIAENAADTAHLNCVHQASWLLSADEYARQAATPGSWKSRFLSVFWEASWEPRGFSACAPFTFDMSVFGWTLPLLRCRGTILQFGPYLSVVRSKTVFGRFVSVMSMTPEGPFRQHIVHRIFAKPGLFAWVACMGMEVGSANMLERDFIIMANKIVLKNPSLVKEENGLPKFRRWYEQFYSANSPTWQDVREQSLQW
ncbi:cholesterol 7-desaturase nvd 1-like [Amblyomma americanum]